MMMKTFAASYMVVIWLTIFTFLCGAAFDWPLEWAPLIMSPFAVMTVLAIFVVIDDL